VCQRLFLIDFADVDDTDTGETADETTEEPIILVLAISGVRTKETMQLAISIGGASFRTLLDSGSTHNFITEDAAARTNLTLAPRGGMRVTVADTPFVIEGEHFSADFYALPLTGYDIVLGTRWLASLGPILWDFSTLQMPFWHGGRLVRWQGIAGPASPFLAVRDLDHLLRALLDEFPDIFAEPAGMPPPRSQDHRITLVPGAAPVAVRPYRYPVAHKDELASVHRHARPRHHPAQHVGLLLLGAPREEGGRLLALLRRLPGAQRHHGQGRLPDPGG
jgi:hypothetical protein